MNIAQAYTGWNVFNLDRGTAQLVRETEKVAVDLRKESSCIVGRRNDEVQEVRKALVFSGTLALAAGNDCLSLESARRAFFAEALALPNSLVVASALSPLLASFGAADQSSFMDEVGLLFGSNVARYLHSWSATGFNIDNVLGFSSEDRQYTLEDIALIGDALDFASRLYANTSRKWSPTTKIPLFAHAAEVGYILLAAHESVDIVVAGILHDALEHYVDQPESTISDDISLIFGLGICQLVSEVTEIPKGSGTWWERKLSVLQPMMKQGREVATVIAGSKISTLTSGVNFYVSGDFTWSKGSLPENIELFTLYGEVFESKGVPNLLCEMFKEELGRLKSL